MELKAFLNENQISYIEEKPAREFTTFKIGGECFVITPDEADKLVTTVRYLKNNGIRYIVIGSGSNVLFSDDGFDGAVVLTGSVKGLRCKKNVIEAYCGTPISAFCKKAYQNSLSGAEFAYGIPGSVGGAVFMNAGAYDGEIKDILSKVKVYSPEKDEIIEYSNGECDFAYRHSRFSDSGEIILSAEFVLEKKDAAEIKAKMDDLINRRKTKQPLNYPSAGSVFKRYPGRYTGQMIESAGLKGYTVGGAQVSEKHAGFIINRGGATAADVCELVDQIKSVIKEREGIDIECELRIIK